MGGSRLGDHLEAQKQMTNAVSNPLSGKPGWTPVQVYVMAALCLVLGGALGYLFRGSGSHSQPTVAQAGTTQPAAQQAGTKQMPSLEDMKKMADKKAEPLLTQLKTDPKNVDTLKQVARIYESTHQFGEAANYLNQIVALQPKDLSSRTELASCLYYSGDVDGAISQLQEALKISPNDANSLFNLGLIRLNGKSDNQGALAAWRQLLKSNPKLESNKKAEVEKLMADASHQSLPIKSAQ
jgi:cytochrome c-type biogenesis protein CcmH/NrfG